MSWLKKAWKWLTASWRRWLVFLAALVATVVGLLLARRRGGPSPSRPGPAPMTPEEGDDAHGKIDAELEEELDAIDREVKDAIAEGDELYRSKP